MELSRQEIVDHMCKGGKVEYPLYNVGYTLKNGLIKTIRERATLKESIAAIKRFDRVFCGQGKAVADVASVFFEPVKEAKLMEVI